jgi:hypothetical protein
MPAFLLWFKSKPKRSAPPKDNMRKMYYLVRSANIIRMFFIYISMIVLLSACEEEQRTNPDQQIAEDNALATVLFDDIFSEVEDAMEFMENNLKASKRKSTSAITCKTIIIEKEDDPEHWPRKVIIDYGEGCKGPDDRLRSGRIIIEVYGEYSDEDYYRRVSFENYFINDYQIDGFKEINNEGRNQEGNLYFSVILREGLIRTPEGHEITREYSRIREWVSGEQTVTNRWDDEYLITGTATGINRKEILYTHSITSPLHVSRRCKWIMSGIVEVEVDGRPLITIDYGEPGLCDRFARVEKGDETRMITLFP